MAVPIIPGYTVDAAMHPPAVGSESEVHFGWRDSDALPVAIKVPHPGHEADIANEAKALGELVHPNIVRLLDAPTDRAGRTLIVMPMLQPCPYFLPMDSREALSTVHGALYALEYLHDKGRIHGDVRSGNLAFTDERQPVLLDMTNYFRKDELRMTDFIRAPEVIQYRIASPRADIYAAGLLILELMGRPFCMDGTEEEVLRAHLTRPLPYVVDEQLTALIRKACAKDPHERFTRAAHMRQAIEDYAQEHF